MGNLQLRIYRSGKECRDEVSRLENEGFVRIPLGDIDKAARLLARVVNNGEKCFADLTPLMAALSANEHMLFGVEDLLELFHDEDVLLVRDSWAQYALKCFPFCIASAEPIVPLAENGFVDRRFPLYVFKERETYDSLVRRASRGDGYFLFSITGMNESPETFANALTNSENSVFLDITSFAALGNAKLLTLEQLSLAAPGLHVLVAERLSGEVYDNFPTLFDEIRDVAELLPEIEQASPGKPEGPRSVCDLDDEEFDEVMASFDERLTGHSNFKRHLLDGLSAFRLAHALGDQRIFSMFLFGESGVGKTETARVLSALLSVGDRYLAKINFESYSSQDSLNSLIGSPAGYVGCEGGELNDKVERARAKVLLCDEFEKTKQDVRAFFLELLEDGSYTDRMGVEHDMDGYIVVFTSNVKDEKELREKIAPELLTRFDLICEFVAPTVGEKRAHAARRARVKAAQYAERLGVDVAHVAAGASIPDEQLGKLSLREIDREVVRQIVSALPVGDLSGLVPRGEATSDIERSE